MKVICISNYGTVGCLTIGKVYHVQESRKSYVKDFYTVISDDGNSYDFLKGRFKTIEEFRDKKIDLILENKI